MAISKQYLQLFDVKPWSHHHQKATIERAPTTVTPPRAMRPPPRHASRISRRRGRGRERMGRQSVSESCVCRCVQAGVQVKK